MPELRQNLATKEWVIIASDRALRPQDVKRREPRKAAPEKDPACPFCSDGGGARFEPNKVPALVPNAPKVRDAGKLYRRLPGEGVHEVVIESPSHAKSFADLTHEQARAAISVYQERFKAATEDLKIALPLLFKNHGPTGHPQSQLIGSSVVPAHIRHRMDEAQKYYEQNGECVVCRMIAEEAEQNERLVADTPYFSAFVLFAALSPFHIWIAPKRHEAAFHELTEAEADNLATVLQDVLARIKAGLGDPDYSFVLQSIPQDRGTTEAFHWYLSLVVAVGGAAGFELGSGMHLNPVVPEEAAKFLNSVKL